MKTAKEIIEYLIKESNYNEQQMIHLVAIHHEPWYYHKMEMLKTLSEYMLKFEYYPNKENSMKGIEEALKWILDGAGREQNQDEN